MCKKTKICKCFVFRYFNYIACYDNEIIKSISYVYGYKIVKRVSYYTS